MSFGAGGGSARSREWSGVDPSVMGLIGTPLGEWLSGMFEREYIPRENSIYTGMFPSGYETKITGLQGATPYRGKMVAGLGEGVRDLVAKGREPFTSVMDISPEAKEARWQSMYARPFEQETLPRIREAYGGPGGYYQSERMESERRAAEDLAYSRATFEQEQEDRAMGAARGLGEYETTGLGGLARSIAQERLNRRFEEFLRTRPEYSPYIQMILSLMGATPTSWGVSSSHQWNLGGGLS